MPLHLDVKRVFSQRSERVKGVEFHPSEPWVLTNLYNGTVVIWNYQTNTVVKSFEMSELPVRCARFIPRKQWVVAGSDDLFLRVFNYNTMDKVAAFEAHTDYIRSVAVHPTLPLVLSAADDMLIKLWDWEQGWRCSQIFEGHSHYVMQVVFNPKDPNTFASASLDATVKVWSIASPVPNFSLEGHTKGVNCVDYYPGGDKPYLLSGADDGTVRIWDYQTKVCVHTLTGHTHNVSAVVFHPELPIVISAAEDASLRIWHSTTYRLEQTLTYGMDRCWALAVLKGTNSVAVGCDEGSLVLTMGRDEPMASMDSTTGKIVWAKHAEVQAASIKSLGSYEVQDGETLPLAVKEMGTSDVYPSFMRHSPNGRFIAVCGDGEYIIYTAVAWRNKHFGQAQDFAWGDDAQTYVIREQGSMIRVFRNFKEAISFRVPFTPTKVHGGRLVGVQTGDAVCFYDWDTATLLRRIDVEAKDVHWSASGEYVTITTETSFYVLKYNHDAVEAAAAEGVEIDPEDGLEASFDVVHSIDEQVRTGMWVGACYIYTNAAWRLNYVVGEEVTTIVHLDKRMYLLGYNTQQQRIYLIDRDYSVVTFSLALPVIEYKTLVLRGDPDAADALLPQIPKNQLDSVARFLESRGSVEKAFEVASDTDLKFDLAIRLGRLRDAMGLAEGEEGAEQRWQQIGDLALKTGAFDIAEEALKKAGDLAALLMLYSANGDASGARWLATAAVEKGLDNVAFMGALLAGDVGSCVDVLEGANRFPEAALFARTYAPSRVSGAVKAWREDLGTASDAIKHVAESLADPEANPELFEGWSDMLAAEGVRARVPATLASDYMDVADAEIEDLITRMRSMPYEPTANGGATSPHHPQPLDLARSSAASETGNGPATDTSGVFMPGLSAGNIDSGTPVASLEGAKADTMGRDETSPRPAEAVFGAEEAPEVPGTANVGGGAVEGNLLGMEEEDEDVGQGQGNEGAGDEAAWGVEGGDAVGDGEWGGAGEEGDLLGMGEEEGKGEDEIDLGNDDDWGEV